MKKGYKKLLIFQGVMLTFIIINSVFYTYLKGYGLCIFLFISLIFFKKTLGFEKDKNQNKKDILLETFIFLLVFFLIYFSSGIFIGFASSAKYSIYELFNTIIPLILGIGVAFLTLAKVVTYCMDVHTALTYSFFLGLIVASAVILFRKIKKINLKHVVFAIIGMILTYIFVSLNPIAANHSLIILFLSGMIAICAMILPGISGSFLLLLLGQYEYMLNALHQFHLSEIIVFVVGALIGILGFSKILNFLLKNHEEVTMAFLIGVMLGSLKVPAVEVANAVSINFAGLLPCVIVAIIGFALIIILETRFDYID